VSKCPELYDVLNEGFYKGGDGGGGHGDDDEDESASSCKSRCVEDILQPILTYTLVKEDTT
jgi:hypothetical protein